LGDFSDQPICLIINPEVPPEERCLRLGSENALVTANGPTEAM